MESPLKASVANTKSSFLSVYHTRQYGLSILCFVLLLFVFLAALQLMIAAFKFLGRDALEQVVIATYNPFVGLFIGLLATAVVQSSSTVTSTVVVLVASGTVRSRMLFYGNGSQYWYHRNEHNGRNRTRDP
ncbi:MAG: hypothetical protein HC912_07945 [Saprospiraceae bacterium]|nr:hypothetical protein [Saprospiraceae bacterium]